jgi:hypothetical protein
MISMLKSVRSVDRVGSDRKIGRSVGRGIGGVQLGIALESGCRPVAGGSTVAAVYGSSNLAKAGRSFEVDTSFADTLDLAAVAAVRAGDAQLDRARHRAVLRRKFATQIVWC